ncbi:MAG: hypothetical protein CYPHOPRED_003295 [Cyphobasidiales sp. Tagirdzhanova-0007]|nr:MAG: hypothetical protein CYPHOPRED_003295 [Cyphobasidiales sp. Tagirdzhanova-0007]
MADLVAVRAELKAWEKVFKAENGREPSKEDIKGDAAIAEKYRLYSKARVYKANGPAAPSVSEAPITPSKHKSGASDKEDSFKTPSKRDPGASAFSANPVASGQTEYAFAPSPSRLRALAASRSFSGSPNHKPSATTSASSNLRKDGPVNLGKSYVADTPRTKARKWLEGDSVSPPVKLTKKTQIQNGEALDSQLQIQSFVTQRPPEKIASSLGASGGGFWEQLEEARKSDDKTEVSMRVDARTTAPGKGEMSNMWAAGSTEEDDDSILAPSPAKPLMNGKGNGKGKQRNIIDLCNDEDTVPSDEEEDAADDYLARKSVSHRSFTADGKLPAVSSFPPYTGATMESARDPFCKAKIASTCPPSRSSHNLYVPASSSVSQRKPKKRTSTAAALTPFDTLEKEAGRDESVSKSLAGQRSRQLASAEGVRAGLGTVTKNSKPLPEKKRARREKDAQEKASNEGKQERMQETDRPTADETVLSEADLDAVAAVMAMETEDDSALREIVEEIGDDYDSEYELRDLSDEYEGYVYSRSDRLSKNGPDYGSLSQSSRSSSLAPATATVELDSQLISLLSLNASPVKNRLAKLHKKRDATVRAILQEPTFLMAKSKDEQRKGLEDLEDEDEVVKELRDGERGLGIADVDLDKMENENSDDDWASDPEGWKDLGDGEMDG